MNDTNTIVVDCQGGNYILRLNRPSALNSFDEPMLVEWNRVLSRINDTSKPLIITGTGRAFCTGGDLKKYLSRLEDLEGLRGYFDLLAEVFGRISNYPGPTIAAINGLTVAGGLEIMCVCDLAVAAQSARIADGHVNYGLHPGGGSSATLSWLIGERLARWLILSGEFIDAAEAERIGLINRVVPDHNLLEEAQNMGAVIAKHSASSIRRVKMLMRRDISEVLLRERNSLLEHFQAPETRKRLEIFARRNEKK